MSWNKELDNIYNLASLHSWITQVDQLLEGFIVKYKSNSEIIQFLCNKLKEKNVPGEHYIISIVILYSFGHPTTEIIELANSYLYGKISKNDILFLKDHLFSGEFPVSSDLSYNITNRSFLSPKKALKTAMEIDSVISKENPINTVLYMSILMDSIDMNEENRAMVAFLLLRVDLDLPKSLKDRVYTYLLEYKEIIQELLQEEFGESINIEDLPKTMNKISKIEIIEDKNDPNSNDIYSKQEKIDGFNQINSTKSDINAEEEIKETDKIKNYSFSKKSDLNILKNKDENTELNSQNKDDFIITNKILNITNGVEKTSIPISNFTAEPNKNKIKKTNIKTLVVNKIRKRNNWKKSIDLLNKNENKDHKKYVEHEKSENIQNENKKASTNIWNIGLKKNIQILESIINGVKKIKSSSNYSVKSDKNFKASGNNKAGSKKINIIISLMISLVLLILIVLLIFKNLSKTDNLPITTPFIESDSFTQESKENDSETLEGSYRPIVNETGTIPSLIPGNFPINISIKDNKIIWVVQKGESITGLFFAFKENKEIFKNTKLEKLVNLSWEDFFNTFKDNNPKRVSYHLIFPGEKFYLPLE